MPFSILYLLLNLAVILGIWFLGQHKLLKYRIPLYVTSSAVLLAVNAFVLYRLDLALGSM